MDILEEQFDQESEESEGAYGGISSEDASGDKSIDKAGVQHLAMAELMKGVLNIQSSMLLLGQDFYLISLNVLRPLAFGPRGGINAGRPTRPT